MVLDFFTIKNMMNGQKAEGEIPDTKTIYRDYLKIAWPAALEGILVSLIGLIDTAMVGRLGAVAISAVGITNQPKFIALSAIRALNFGITAMVARRWGENERDKAVGTLKQGLLIGLVLDFIICFVTYTWAKEMLIFAGAQSDVIDLAETYFKIISIGNFFSFIGLTINAAQIGVGNTKISLYTNLMANCVNLVFNFLLINGIWIFPRLEVKGAAIATAIGNIVAFLISLYSVSHKDSKLFMFTSKGWRFDRRTVSGIGKIGSSAMVEQAFTRIGLLAYSKMVAGLGTVVFATHQICMNFLGFTFAFGEGMGSASSALVGQSLGAKRPDMALLYGKTAQRCALVFSAFLFLIFIPARYEIVRLFTDDPQIIADGGVIMIYMAFSCILQTSAVVYFGGLRGAGDTGFVALVSLVSVCVLRPVISWVLCFPVGLGLVGAWIGLAMDQVIRLFLSGRRFYSEKWKYIKL